jgi:hypothetical protein
MDLDFSLCCAGSSCGMILYMYACTQTALDLLSSAAMTRVNGGGGEGMVAGDHREVGFLSLVLRMDTDLARCSATDMKKSVFCVGGRGDGGGGAPASRPGEPAPPADARGPHPQLQHALPSAHPSPAAPGKSNVLPVSNFFDSNQYVLIIAHRSRRCLWLSIFCSKFKETKMTTRLGWNLPSQRRTFMC